MYSGGLQMRGFCLEVELARGGSVTDGASSSNFESSIIVLREFIRRKKQHPFGHCQKGGRGVNPNKNKFRLSLICV